jgi:DNA-binding LytR/AlgR family response regulator
LQVHRAHWVARDQVRTARRSGARAILTMTDGSEVPVSRSFVPVVKAAGLLP